MIFYVEFFLDISFGNGIKDLHGCVSLIGGAREGLSDYYWFLWLSIGRGTRNPIAFFHSLRMVLACLALYL